MALPATAVWEVRTTGSVNNGGFWNTAGTGTDYSQSGSVQYPLTGATAVGAGAVILHASAASDMVGNGLKVVSGSGFTVGWYEVISVVVGVSITTDRNCTSGVGSSGVVNIGGAVIWDGGASNLVGAVVAGNKVWTATGSYSSVQGATSANGNGTTGKITFEGYNTSRGDFPVGSTRPSLSLAGLWTFGSFNIVKHMNFSGSTAQSIIVGANNQVSYCKCTNTSVTSDRAAWFAQNQGTFFKCEGVSYRGRAFETQGAVTNYIGCYAHDSDMGFHSNSAGSAHVFFRNCISAGNVTRAISCGTGSGSTHHIESCTLYGAENKLGVGVNIPTGLVEIKVINSIVYGFVTGVTHADASNFGFDDFNAYNNNTTDNTNWVKGPSDSTANPTFTSVAQYTGTTATSSTNVLTDSGANFANVVDNQDFCYISVGTGTGIALKKYLITSHAATTLTLSSNITSSGSGTSITYEVTYGHNFAIGTNLRALGMLGNIPGGLSTGYLDIGAVQLQSQTSTDPGIANVRSGTGYTLNDASLTGTLDLPAEADVKLGVVFDNTTKTGTYVAPAGGSFTFVG